MGNCKSWCGDSEEQKTEMKMDGSEPVNLKDRKIKGKKGKSSSIADDPDVRILSVRKFLELRDI